MTKIHKVFIANRGEIARRIAVAAQHYKIAAACLVQEGPVPGYLQGLGLDTIAVADESPSLYLNSEQMIRYAQDSGCDALHPGFGFLSENAQFAAAVQEAGLTWIGPGHKAIAELASKARSREIAEKADVPCVPGLEIPAAESAVDANSIAAATDFTRTHGFPVLIKAALGGGGKGMRVVRAGDELSEAMKRASSEALNSFGDASLIVERFLENPRHVEVQILADSHGGVQAIGDRDCSIQRRHQKVIEEAPAPFIHSKVRAEMHRAACDLAAQVGYTSAGTVEYLLDGSDASEDQKFYFLEMNTRLQVEHPVSEEVFGIDLVQEQFRIAENKKLRADLAKNAYCHSIEARLYAEDPEQDFMPAPGAIHGFWPATGDSIRWELGLDPIDEVSGRFDPMIAKLVVKAPTRKMAIAELKKACEETLVSGPANNLGLIAAICEHPEFALRIQGTGFLRDHTEVLLEGMRKAKERLTTNAQIAFDQQQTPSTNNQLIRASRSHFLSQGQPIVFTVDHTYESQKTSARYYQAGFFHSNQNGQSYKGKWLHAVSDRKEFFTYLLDGQSFHFEKLGGLSAFATSGSSDEVTAPVPGKLIQILCAVGDEVEEGTTVCILESMKMEFEVKAPRKGMISEILVTSQQQVDADDCLINFEKDS